MISVVDTPNPDTKKFIFDKVIVEEGSKEFTRNDDINLKIVKSIFSVNNIDLIYFDKNFISIRKAKDSDWDDLTKELLAILNQEITVDFKPLIFKEESQFDDDISKRIEEVLNEKIRPAVAMDGGDIRLKSYKDGVAEVLLKGACAGCPSSTVTLKHGVERMIKHYVPEVNSVEAFNINE
ncbi:NifU family protein [Pelagibacteraceae bacterium]|nr:NifU family protein [Pelagibacteraceae bacterium]